MPETKSISASELPNPLLQELPLWLPLGQGQRLLIRSTSLSCPADPAVHIRTGHVINRHSFEELAITLEQAIRAGLLPFNHRDPFDRLLVAQAQSLNAPIVSADPIFDHYGVKRLW